MSRRRPIYVVNQYGWPDGGATAQLLCQVLYGAPSAYKIIVLQSDAQYSTASGTTIKPPVQIKRLWAPKARTSGRGHQLLRFIAFYSQLSLQLMCKPIGSDIIVMTTPPFLNWLGAAAKRVRGGRLISWEMDVYPEILFATNTVARNSIIGRCLAHVTRWARLQTDFSIVLGPCMTALIARTCPELKTVELQNWADGEVLFPVRVPGSSSGLRLLYSGNLGVAHDVDTVLGAIDNLVGIDIEIIFAGGGVKMPCVRGVSRSNVKFQDPCDYSGLNNVLNDADIGLVTQSVECLGCVVPSKFYGLLAAGRPVLYIGPREATVAQVILTHNCGWVVDLGNVGALVSLLSALVKDRRQVVEAGLRAREVFESRFTAKLSIDRFWRSVLAEK
jgi:colanic acid biosynthesis glycosyl transferase WcaI